MPAALSAIAFPILSGPTTWGMIAWRAGIMKDQIAPWISDEMSRWYQRTHSVKIASPTTNAQQSDNQLANLDQPLAVEPVGNRPTEQGQHQHWNSRAGTYDPKERSGAGEVVHQVPTGEHLHLHPAHHRHHAQPQDHVVAALQGRECLTPPSLGLDFRARGKLRDVLPSGRRRGRLVARDGPFALTEPGLEDPLLDFYLRERVLEGPSSSEDAGESTFMKLVYCPNQVAVQGRERSGPGLRAALARSPQANGRHSQVFNPGPSLLRVKRGIVQMIT